MEISVGSLHPAENPALFTIMGALKEYEGMRLSEDSLWRAYRWMRSTQSKHPSANGFH